MKNAWTKTKLGELAEVIAGQSPKGANYNTDGEGMPFYQGKKEFGEKFIGEPTKWTTQVTRVAAEGDVLMSVRAPVGPVNFATHEMCIGRGLAAIRSSNGLDREFLFYLLLSKRNEIEGTEGAVFPSINKGQIQQIEIAAPPLPEQQRIVGVLDEAFDSIATAKATAEKNLRNARALFESHLNSVFTQRGTGWVEKRLDEVCEITMGTSPKGSTYNSKGDGVPLVNGPVEFSEDSFGKTIRSKFTTEPNKLCKAGDAILCVRGSTTGRMNIAGFDACIGRGVAAIRAKEYQPWINHFINASRQVIYRLGTGATFPNITGPVLAALKLSMPEVAKQRELAFTLDALRAETQLLESLYQRKLDALDELKKSLLHQAFAGEL